MCYAFHEGFTFYEVVWCVLLCSDPSCVLLAYVERLQWTCHFLQDRATSQHREKNILFLPIASLRCRTFPLNLLLRVKSVVSAISEC